METVRILISAARVVLIVFACLLMSIGFADIIVGIKGRVWNKRKACLFAVVAVKDAADLESDINYARNALEKAGINGEILLFDNGTDDETKALCSRLYGTLLDESEITARIVGEIKRR